MGVRNFNLRKSLKLERRENGLGPALNMLLRTYTLLPQLTPFFVFAPLQFSIPLPKIFVSRKNIG